jgi:hypothetical protein
MKTADEAFEKFLEAVRPTLDIYMTRTDPRHEQHMRKCSLAGHLNALRNMAARPPRDRTLSVCQSSWAFLMEFKNEPEILPILQEYRTELGQFIRETMGVHLVQTKDGLRPMKFAGFVRAEDIQAEIKQEADSSASPHTENPSGT